MPGRKTEANEMDVQRINLLLPTRQKDGGRFSAPQSSTVEGRVSPVMALILPPALIRRYQMSDQRVNVFQLAGRRCSAPRWN